MTESELTLVAAIIWAGLAAGDPDAEDYPRFEDAISMARELHAEASEVCCDGGGG